jgi:hypothetical protein
MKQGAQGDYKKVGHGFVVVTEQEQQIELGVLVAGWQIVLLITQQERQTLILSSMKAAAQEVEQLLRVQVEVGVPEGFGF